MKKSTREYLVEQYNQIPFIQRTSATCLKYYYVYKGVNVNVFFDAFDVKSVSLNIILNAENKYYYTPLNIMETSSTTEYLKGIPREILDKILVDNQLIDFYENMETHICQDKPYINYYNQEKIFVNTICYSNNKIDLPFWKGIRRVRMSDKTVYELNAKADISLEILKTIQSKGITLVRTADSSKRKELTLILKECGICLS